MSHNIKNKAAILQKLGIEKLNPMQEAAHAAIRSKPAVILLSPTGTGKTLAFSLPLVEALDNGITGVQALILVPSRELAIQIEQVIREMGSGFKANAVYGGRAFSKDKIELQHPPAILIGTPGRVADHLRRETFSVSEIKFLILDEFDKSLEVGFEAEMREILEALTSLQHKILTSATSAIEIPAFAKVENPEIINYLQSKKPDLKVKVVNSPSRDKLETLVQLLQQTGTLQGIVFCNFRDSIASVSEYLIKHKIDHGMFYGGMEQKDRERALIKFRNGTHRVLLATDLAARGIDVPEIGFIIHYQLPFKEEEFTHRNGRTARMLQSGVAYVLRWEKEELPSFIDQRTTIDATEITTVAKKETENDWETLFISGGRKDKISKGDIAGLFLKQGQLDSKELGTIELKHDCSFVSVPAGKSNSLIDLLNNSRLKKKKVRISKI